MVQRTRHSAGAVVQQILFKSRNVQIEETNRLFKNRDLAEVKNILFVYEIEIFHFIVEFYKLFLLKKFFNPISASKPLLCMS